MIIDTLLLLIDRATRPGSVKRRLIRRKERAVEKWIEWLDHPPTKWRNKRVEHWARRVCALNKQLETFEDG